MDRSLNKLAREKLEQEISQRILALYSARLGHQPSKVTCQLFDNKVVVVLEGAITPSEQILLHSGQQDLAQQVRSDLDKALQPQLKQIIEEVMHVPALDLLTDSTLETGRAGSIAVLASVPPINQTKSVAKALSPDGSLPR
jgi:uncharacterized protein YbcI